MLGLSLLCTGIWSMRSRIVLMKVGGRWLSTVSVFECVDAEYVFLKCLPNHTLSVGFCRTRIIK